MLYVNSKINDNKNYFILFKPRCKLKHRYGEGWRRFRLKLDIIKGTKKNSKINYYKDHLERGSEILHLNSGI